MSNEELWKMQVMWNENTNTQCETFLEQIKFLLEVCEDHEADMQKMCDKINALEERLSKYEDRD